MGNKAGTTGEQFHKNCKFAWSERRAKLFFFSCLFAWLVTQEKMKKEKRRENNGERASKVGRWKGREWRRGTDRYRYEDQRAIMAVVPLWWTPAGGQRSPCAASYSVCFIYCSAESHQIRMNKWGLREREEVKLWMCCMWRSCVFTRLWAAYVRNE